MTRWLWAAALCGLLAAPGQAQTTPADDQDLRCAAFSALVVATQETTEAQFSFTIAMSWFLGRYEGRNGRPFEQALTPEYVTANFPAMETAADECVPLLIGVSERFSQLGEDLVAYSRETDGE